MGGVIIIYIKFFEKLCYNVAKWLFHENRNNKLKVHSNANILFSFFVNFYFELP